MPEYVLILLLKQFQTTSEAAAFSTPSTQTVPHQYRKRLGFTVELVGVFFQEYNLLNFGELLKL